ncbi:hypothetical protein FVEG_08141 [Fusarium verticillioides 7600]|uniref:Uncharacterized protein n=1 Tax=Gibberella moniliformis (strain M3125 / FGSC 7600) TaxID=334819 RepID=W7M9Q8_GIBM7|nr:hypothetical protein FVEG_08141 [Fusarium verticillioides 7600]EWG48328.1 hypothetical protein FVEG_08141 [Fusarium verticillioides 7600]
MEARGSLRFNALETKPKSQKGFQQYEAHGVPPAQGAPVRKFPIVASLTIVQQM